MLDYGLRHRTLFWSDLPRSVCFGFQASCDHRTTASANVSLKRTLGINISLSPPSLPPQPYLYYPIAVVATTFSPQPSNFLQPLHRYQGPQVFCCKISSKNVSPRTLAIVFWPYHQILTTKAVNTQSYCEFRSTF
jgi:hypothetical protein